MVVVWRYLVENRKRQRIGIRTGYLVRLRTAYYSRLVDGFNNNRIFDVETDLMNNNLLNCKNIYEPRVPETSSQTLKPVWLKKTTII